MPRFVAFALFALFAVGCAERPHLAFEDRLLRVRIVSDYVPFHEAMRADVDIYQGGVATASPLVEHFDRALAIDAPLADGVVVAFVRGVVPGTYTLRGALRRADGSVLGTAELVVESQGTELYTLYITSGCAGIECEAGTTCLQGECVDSRCTPLAPAFCPPDLLCEADSECSSAGICSMADCMEGICLDVSNVPSTCDEGEWCAREDGCVPNTGEPVEPTGCENDPRLNRVCAVPGRACWYGYWTCTNEAVTCTPFHTYPVGASCGTNMYCDSAGECGEGTPCPAGYTGTVETGCEDINECDVGVAGAPACDPFTTITCRNTPGSFACVGATDILQLTISQTKQFDFDWQEIPAADTYNLLVDPDGASGYSVVATGLTDNEYTFTEPLHFRVNARYALQVCIGAVCETVDDVSVASTLAEAVGYFKASDNTVAEVGADQFGFAVALSGDGQVLAVGAPYEDGRIAGVRAFAGAGTDNGVPDSGAVYVYRRRDTVWEGTEWVAEAYVKAHTTSPTNVMGSSDQQLVIGGVGENHRFGYAIALSYDGSQLVVGAPGDELVYRMRFTSGGDWNSTVLAENAGSVYSYRYAPGVGWAAAPSEYLSLVPSLISGTAIAEEDLTKAYGGTLALSSDGSTLAVGTSGGNGNYVFVYGSTGIAWTEQGRLEGVLTDLAFDVDDCFGAALSLTSDGNTLLIGAPYDDSMSRVVTPGVSPPNDNGREDSGAAYLYVRSAPLNTWTLSHFMKATNADEMDYFAESVAISGDGSTFVIGARGEDSNGTGSSVTTSSNNTLQSSGALYVFSLASGVVSNTAFVKVAEHMFVGGDHYAANLGGQSLAISEDGTVIAAGIADPRVYFGVNGVSTANQGKGGAVLVFSFDGSDWLQVADVKPSNRTGIIGFGNEVALSHDGNTMATMSSAEASNATGVNGNQANMSSYGTGAVYLY